ncbi:MAG: transglycosylase SLT domain-containing protein [Treponema sp.]|nr:transglycosylase SLT domain-containing protein [Treponema sp.]
MKVFFLRFEGALPVFSGILGSMFVCALIAVHGPGKLARPQSVQTESPGEAESPDFPVNNVAVNGAVREALLPPPPAPEEDFILDFYRNPDTRDWTVDFFTSLCGSRDIAAVILANAAVFNVSPGLAFALCWEESRYNPLALNRKNRDESVDRGLFQLNSRSFPGINELDFFNPSINAWYGMSHLRLCLNTGETEIAALAMYNAGTGRVRATGAPKNTLNYIQRILECRWRIEEVFLAEFASWIPRFTADHLKDSGSSGEGETAAEKSAGARPVIAAVKPLRPRLVRLAPLSGDR